MFRVTISLALSISLLLSGVVVGAHAITPASLIIAYQGARTQRIINDPPGRWASHIYLYDVGRGLERRVSSLGNNCYEPTWSPDGRFIAYQRRNTGDYAMVLLDPWHGTERLLTSRGDAQYLAWSPDGKWIAFTGWSFSTESYEIYAINVETGGEIRVTEDIYNDTYPGWSPDGQQILYSSNRTDFDFDLYISDTSATNAQPFLEFDGVGRTLFARWSPDGSRVAWTQMREITLLDVASGNRRPLVDSQGTDVNGYFLGWSPDSRQLVIADFGLDVLDLETLERRHLLLPDGRYGIPSFMPTPAASDSPKN